MLKELVRKIKSVPKPKPKPKPKPSRGCRYIVAKLYNNCTVAWDYGSIFPIGGGLTMTLAFREGYEGLTIDGITMPDEVVFVDEEVVVTEVGSFWVQLARPRCPMLPLRGDRRKSGPGWINHGRTPSGLTVFKKWMKHAE